MNTILILFWLGFSFLVGLVSTNKSIGFWGAFFLSLLLSPIIGLIISLVSSNKKSRVPSSIINLEMAKKAEHRGDYEEAIKFYNDAIYDFKNAPISKEAHLRNYREIQITLAEAKILEFKGYL